MPDFQRQRNAAAPLPVGAGGAGDASAPPAPPCPDSTQPRAAERAAPRRTSLTAAARALRRPESRSRWSHSKAMPREFLRSSRSRRAKAGGRGERPRARSRGRSLARSLPGLASARRERSTQPARQRANFLRAGVPSALLRSIVPRLSLGAARGAHASEPRRASQRAVRAEVRHVCADRSSTAELTAVCVASLLPSLGELRVLRAQK